MPKIREYQPQGLGRVSAGPEVPRAGFSTGAGVGALGRSLQDASSQLAQYAEERSNFEAQSELANARSVFEKELDQVKQNAPAWDSSKGEENYVSTAVGKKFEEYQAKVLENGNWTQSARDRLQLGFSSLNEQVRAQSFAIDGERAKTHTKQTFIDNKNKSLNRVTMNPMMVENEILEYGKLVDAAPNFGINQSVKDAAKQEFRMDAWDTALDSSVKQLVTKKNVSEYDIDKMVKELKTDGNKWAKNTSNPTFERAMFALNSARETVRVKREGEAIEFFKETLAHVSETGAPNPITKEMIVSRVSSPEKQKLMIEQLDIANNTAKANAFVKTSSDAEINAEIMRINSSLVDVPHDKYYETKSSMVGIIKAKELRDKQMEKDAAGYVMRESEPARELFSKVNEAIQSGDPVKIQSASSDYSNYVKAEQERLRPGVQPQIIPANMAQYYQAQFESMKNDPQGPTKAASTLGQLRSTWGNDFPIAVDDLRRHKAISPSQYVVANYMNAKGNRGIAEAILKADSNDPDVLKRLADEDGFKNNYNSAIDAINSEFKKSMGGSVSGNEIIDSYATAVAKTMMANPGVYSAKQLMNELINNHYKFDDGLRFPKSVNGREVDISSVVDGKKHVMSKEYLSGLDMELPMSGLRPEDAKDSIIGKIRSDGYFQNYSDDGLMLMLNGNPIYRKTDKGAQPVVLTWDELAGLGTFSKLKPANESAIPISQRGKSYVEAK